MTQEVEAVKEVEVVKEEKAIEAVEAKEVKPVEKVEKKKKKAVYTEEDLQKAVEDQIAKLELEKVAAKDAAEANNYAADTLLTDKAFILRLKALNVHKHYLMLFRDQDSVMNDSQIWKKIRFSNIEPK